MKRKRTLIICCLFTLLSVILISVFYSLITDKIALKKTIFDISQNYYTEKVSDYISKEDYKFSSNELWLLTSEGKMMLPVIRKSFQLKNEAIYHNILEITNKLDYLRELYSRTESGKKEEVLINRAKAEILQIIQNSNDLYHRIKQKNDKTPLLWIWE